MALTSGEVKEVEVLIRKEMKSFLESNTLKQFGDKLIDKIAKEIKRGKLEGDVKDITLRMFREFYQFMWMNRSYWCYSTTYGSANGSTNSNWYGAKLKCFLHSN